MNNWQEEILAVNREDARKISEQYRFAWTRDILLMCGIEHLILECFPEEDDPEQMTVKQKAELRQILASHEITVLDDNDYGTKIYFQNNLIAEWKKPQFVLREDLKQINPRDRLYIAIHLKFWSVFNEEEDDD